MENHNTHLCVDELVASIIQAALRIEEVWQQKNLTCQSVKDMGLKSVDDNIWILLEALEEVDHA